MLNCLLKTGGSHQTIFNWKCFFDIKTCFDPFKPLLLVLKFETFCFGYMSRIAFGDRKMASLDIRVVENNIAKKDYCVLDLPNLLAQNKLNGHFKLRSRCLSSSFREAEPWN